MFTKLTIPKKINAQDKSVSALTLAQGLISDSPNERRRSNFCDREVL